MAYSTPLDFAECELIRDENLELKRLYSIVGSKQLTRKKKKCAPSWLLDKTVDKEVNEAWNGAYKEVPDSAILFNSNIIESHIVYKIKIKEGKKRSMARLCPHGNHDPEKGKV